jgi:hypothetical protein
MRPAKVKIIWVTADKSSKQAVQQGTIRMRELLEDWSREGTGAG